MGQGKVALERLVTKTSGYLEKMGYSESSISQYHSAWNHLKAFIEKRGESCYNASIGEAFIYDVIGDGTYKALSRWEKQIIACTNMLTEYFETGSVKFRRSKVIRELNGPIGKTMLEYVNHRKSHGISTLTADEYKYHLEQFLVFLGSKSINSTESLSKALIIEYANSLGFASNYTRHRNLSVLKGFLRFLFDKGHISLDLSTSVPKCKRIRQPKLPSTYTKDEIEQILQVIDRGSPKGKRDYAMVLITARLGLRATDVCNLEFSNFLWEQSLISLSQSKTGETIQFPLLAGIGNAVIDYLKYGRPESELPFVFLHVVSPYDRLNRSTLHSIISQYMRLAGIKVEGIRKRGPHALRHSLAGILLEKKTPVPIIAEVLGHRSIESTRLYLRIDMNALKQCALDVPPISTSFYGRRAHS